MPNHAIARRLDAFADQLDLVDPNLYRRRAYRRAAEAILAAEREITDVFQESGRAGLRAVPGIGTRMARVLEHLLRTGEMRLPRSVIKTGEDAVRMTTEQN